MANLIDGIARKLDVNDATRTISHAVERPGQKVRRARHYHQRRRRRPHQQWRRGTIVPFAKHLDRRVDVLQTQSLKAFKVLIIG